VRQGNLDLGLVWHRQLARWREVMWRVLHRNGLQWLVRCSMQDSVAMWRQVGWCGRRHGFLFDEEGVRRRN
jgi:hypothetical protein